jgi:hypothetical protein
VKIFRRWQGGPPCQEPHILPLAHLWSKSYLDFKMLAINGANCHGKSKFFIEYIRSFGSRELQGCQEHLFKISKSDFKNQILGVKISKMLIFHYISYKFDKISHLKNQSWYWKIRFCQIWHLKISTFLKNQQTWHPWRTVVHVEYSKAEN